MSFQGHLAQADAVILPWNVPTTTPERPSDKKTKNIISLLFIVPFRKSMGAFIYPYDGNNSARFIFHCALFIGVNARIIYNCIKRGKLAIPKDKISLYLVEMIVSSKSWFMFREIDHVHIINHLRWRFESILIY